MNWIDWIVLAVVAAIVIGAVVYIRRTKKKSNGCIGCPDSGKCPGKCNCTKE